jgi:RNA polymerase sigma-70 factor (ECF subfamily)
MTFFDTSGHKMPLPIGEFCRAKSVPRDRTLATQHKAYLGTHKGALVAAPNIDEAVQCSDDELIQLVKHGDHEAFSILYDRYFRRIHNFVARRINNPADVEETVQEIFINVFSSIESYRGEAPFLAWVFGITRRSISSRFKKKHHPTVSINDDEHENSQDAAAGLTLVPSALETIEYKQRVRALDRVIKSLLTPEQRTLFELHHLQQRPIQDIARTLNRSEDSIKSNLYRARKIIAAN